MFIPDLESNIILLKIIISVGNKLELSVTMVCASLCDMCNGKSLLRVLVTGEEVDTLLEERLDLGVASSCLFLQENRGQHLQEFWHPIGQGYQSQLV